MVSNESERDSLGDCVLCSMITTKCDRYAGVVMMSHERERERVWFYFGFYVNFFNNKQLLRSFTLSPTLASSCGNSYGN